MTYKTDDVSSRACSKCGAAPGTSCIGRRGPRKSFHIERIRNVKAVEPAAPSRIVWDFYARGMSAAELYEVGSTRVQAAHRQMFDDAIALCGSPIEELFLSALMAQCQFHPNFRVVATGKRPPALSHTINVFCVPQAHFGPYRVDFALIDTRGPVERITIVECDGHDFHDRTKDQARQDRERDRWFALNGMTVLRFTGSELYANPMAVADEVSEFLERAQ